jgi:vacuolar protein sorting-associated protein IST1
MPVSATSLYDSKETPDPSLMDAVCALIYAAPHTELKELHMAREMLMQKFGRPFAVSVVNNDPPCVPARVLNKMAIYIPPPELVDAYLQEIARGYGITWTSDRLEAKAEEDRRADLEREVKAADDKAESNKNGGVTTKVRRAGNILVQDRLLIKIFTACCRHPTRPEIRRS